MLTKSTNIVLSRTLTLLGEGAQCSYHFTNPIAVPVLLISVVTVVYIGMGLLVLIVW